MTSRNLTSPMIKDISQVSIDWSLDNCLETRNEYDANDNIIYRGYAKPGSAEGDLAWFIIKYTWAAGTIAGYNNTKVELASDQVKFDKSWTARATYF